MTTAPAIHSVERFLLRQARVDVKDFIEIITSKQRRHP
jgi:hypothetical protein